VSPPAELGVYLLAINEKNKGLAAQMIFSLNIERRAFIKIYGNTLELP
jgi:hypothetical protein